MSRENAQLQKQQLQKQQLQKQQPPKALKAITALSARPAVARGSSYDVLGESFGDSDDEEEEEEEEVWAMAAEMRPAPPAGAKTCAAASSSASATARAAAPVSGASKRSVGGSVGGSSSSSRRAPQVARPRRIKVDVAQMYAASLERKELLALLAASKARAWTRVEINAEEDVLNCGIRGVRGDVTVFSAVLSCCAEGAPHAALVAERKAHLAEAAALRADVGATNAALFDALLNRVVTNCVMIGEHEMLARAVLAGLGFSPRDQATPTRMLEQQLLRRLELARALVRATGASGKPRAAPLLVVLNDPDTFLDLRAKGPSDLFFCSAPYSFVCSLFFCLHPDLRAKVWLERYVPNHTLGGAIVLIGGRFSPFATTCNARKLPRGISQLRRSSVVVQVGGAVGGGASPRGTPRATPTGSPAGSRSGSPTAASRRHDVLAAAAATKLPSSSAPPSAAASSSAAGALAATAPGAKASAAANAQKQKTKQKFACGVLVGSYGSGKSKMLHRMTRLCRSRSPRAGQAQETRPKLALLFSRANAESLGRKLPASTTVAQWLHLRDATMPSWLSYSAATRQHISFHERVERLSIDGKARLLLAYIFSVVDRRELAHAEAVAAEATAAVGATECEVRPFFMSFVCSFFCLLIFFVCSSILSSFVCSPFFCLKAAECAPAVGAKEQPSPLPTSTEEHVLGFDEPLRIFEWASPPDAKGGAGKTGEELARRLSQLFQRAHTLRLKVVVATHDGHLARLLSDEAPCAQVWAIERGSNKIHKLRNFYNEFPAYLKGTLERRSNEYGAVIETRMRAHLQRLQEENEGGWEMQD
jgi:energy-coupling factor transporter ATP-binding protein EcfA2